MKGWTIFHHFLLGVTIFGFVMVALMMTLPSHEIKLIVKIADQEVVTNTPLQVWHFVFLAFMAELGKLFLILYLGLQAIPNIYRYWRDRNTNKKLLKGRR